MIGGVIGGMLLLNTGEKLFRSLVPFLILSASGLLAVQGHYVLGSYAESLAIADLLQT
jgi:hypothetical protein